MISIIVPVYNVEKYLEQCIDSLISQTYKNIEIILVDDGSTDNSGKICDAYEKKYCNIKAIHKTNAGLGMARNTGIDNMKGEYVTFVDSDDYIDEELIERLYNNMISNDVEMCKSGFRRVNDAKKILAIRKYDNVTYLGEEAKQKMLPRMLGSTPEKKDSVEMNACGVMYKASIIQNNQIRFPSERAMISEDLIFNIDYLQYANGASLIEYIGYNYRGNQSSLTKSYKKDRFEASKYFYIEVKKKLLVLGYSDAELQRLSRLFFIYVKVCLSQESIKVSKKKYKDSITSIKNICNDSLVRSVIENYPYNKLGMKQKVFIYLIKYKFVHTIYFFANKNII